MSDATPFATAARLEPVPGAQYPREDLMQPAYERVEAEAEAQPPEALADIQLNPGNMVQVIIGSLPEIEMHRPALERLGEFDMRYLDRLRDYALALGYVHSKYREASGKPSNAALQELLKNRQLLVAHATAFAASGFFRAERVDSLNHGKSYQDIAYDVIGLTNVFLEDWPKVENNTLLTHEQLVHAQAVATEFLRTLGERDQGPGERAALSLRRRRVYTLAYNAYEEVRAALRYLRRRFKDHDSIAPSLHESRGQRRGRKDDTTSEEQTAIDDTIAALEANDEADATENFSVSSGAAPNASPGVGVGETRVGFPGSPAVLASDDEDN